MVALSCRVLAVRVSLLSASFLRLLVGFGEGDPPFSVPANPPFLLSHFLPGSAVSDQPGPSSLEPMGVLKSHGACPESDQ
ncbi:hypothetical protein OPV22_023699 [Ensete ventricosum]|uniref:Secreted protein n=1 Tax=Ensete ventricosum TaxID=4639 RepID=A0AAV8QTI9_ENSVE|nr:hypothetical protein OPV22_023699 [Ensete ventricosum]